MATRKKQAKPQRQKRAAARKRPSTARHQASARNNKKKRAAPKGSAWADTPSRVAVWTDEPNIVLSASEKGALAARWRDAARQTPLPAGTGAAQALALGVNFRVNLLKAFEAAWETAKAVIKGTAVAHAPFDIGGWLDVGIETVGAINAIFASLVQRMRPIDYVTCLVLSNRPDGFSNGQLQEAVKTFLDNPDASHFAWYFALTEDRIRRAREVTEGPNWFQTVLANLRKDNFVEERDGKLIFKSRNFTVGWSGD